MQEQLLKVDQTLKKVELKLFQPLQQHPQDLLGLKLFQAVQQGKNHVLLMREATQITMITVAVIR